MRVATHKKTDKPTEEKPSEEDAETYEAYVIFLTIRSTQVYEYFCIPFGNIYVKKLTLHTYKGVQIIKY